MQSFSNYAIDADRRMSATRNWPASRAKFERFTAEKSQDGKHLVQSAI